MRRWGTISTSSRRTANAATRSRRDANSTHPVYTGAIVDPFVQQGVVLRAFGGRQGYIDFFNDTARIRAARTAARNRMA